MKRPARYDRRKQARARLQKTMSFNANNAAGNEAERKLAEYEAAKRAEQGLPEKDQAQPGAAMGYASRMRRHRRKHVGIPDMETVKMKRWHILAFIAAIVVLYYVLRV